jgi:hypothetical protein
MPQNNRKTNRASTAHVVYADQPIIARNCMRESKQFFKFDALRPCSCERLRHVLGP